MPPTSLALLVVIAFSVTKATAHQDERLASAPIIADLELMRDAGVTPLHYDAETGLAYAEATGEMRATLSALAHRQKRCGGYTVLETSLDVFQARRSLDQIKSEVRRHSAYAAKRTISPYRPLQVELNPKIQSALSELQAENLKANIQWLTSFGTRHAYGSKKDSVVDDLLARLNKMAEGASFPVQVESIDHRSVDQRSVRVTIPGRLRADEVIVLGGHLDSTSWHDIEDAPGADDNASGSSNLIEALRVLLLQDQPERTIEFYWYAGEELGLLGSGEIARTAKSAAKKIVAVLQLDMTLFPGIGPNNIASIRDFTSPWLHEYLLAINSTYLKTLITDSKCGYACSDHASWHGQGYPALMPAEASFENMSPYIHSSADVINQEMSFEHSLIFSKIALILAMDLGNSTHSQPY